MTGVVASHRQAGGFRACPRGRRKRVSAARRIKRMEQDAMPPAAEGEAVTAVTDRRALFALPGLILAGGALLCATLTLFVLLGLTPIAPTYHVVVTSVVVNSFFVLGLMALIAREVSRLLKAR